MYQAVGLKEVLLIIKSEFRLLFFVTLFVAVLGISTSYFLPKEYEKKVDILVNFSQGTNAAEGISSAEIDTNLRLIETYKYILGSGKVLDKVADEIGKNGSDLKNRIEVESNNKSQIITIKANGSSAKEAEQLVNLTAQTFQTEIKTLMKVDNVQILTWAVTDGNERPVRPNHLMNSVISFLLGGFLSIFILLLKETIFSRPTSQEKVERIIKIPSLGVIPFMTDKTKKRGQKLHAESRTSKIITKLNPYSAVSEAYRAIRTNLQYMMGQSGVRTLLVTSSNSGEGKSITAANLAICMAIDQVKTVYVDLDLRKGVGQLLFNIPSRQGVTSYIEGGAEVDTIISKTETPNLFYIGTGPLPPHPAEIISSEKMDDFLTKLKEEFDLVIVDTPPLLVADALSLSTKVDGCIFIINAEKTRMDQVEKSIQKLQKVKANIIGSILNSSKKTKHSQYYY